MLAEPDRPHGLGTGTAAAIIKLLSSAIDRGRDLGPASWVVPDSADDRATAWLVVLSQGATTSLARDEDGRFVPANTKDDTKTVGSRRRVPICRPLADLITESIRMVHTDPATGVVNTGVRLIAGLRSEDISGSHALRSSLESASSNDAAAD